MEYREEEDSLGSIKVSNDSLWGAQTQRSKENFLIGNETMPIEVVHAYAIVKKAAARTNCELGKLPKEKMLAISDVCDEILEGKLDDQFPLVVWQTGSGTQTNMNVNEVISNRAISKMGGVIGSKDPIHPNDDVNKSQSSNDTFPTAMHISCVTSIQKELFPKVREFHEALKEKAESFKDIVKTGRTHLMDATPLTLGQEFSGYASQIEHGLRAVENSMDHLYELALGATAVGTGINTPKGFREKVVKEMADMTGYSFVPAKNTFEALAAHDALVEMSGSLKCLAVAYLKIVNDIRWLASGPRCGIGELILPSNEPGSSIMPGKVNPTQCEALSMLAVQVMGNDATIGFAGSQGNFELNVYKPVMVYNLLQSIRLLADGASNFTQKCLKDIEPNEPVISDYVNSSLMLATALNTKIGYDKASQIVKKAYKEHKTLKEAAIELKLLSSEEFDAYIDPSKMVGEF
jgi:fumarate hydratase, class II